MFICRHLNIVCTYVHTYVYVICVFRGSAATSWTTPASVPSTAATHWLPCLCLSKMHQIAWPDRQLQQLQKEQNPTPNTLPVCIARSTNQPTDQPTDSECDCCLGQLNFLKKLRHIHFEKLWIYKQMYANDRVRVKDLR